LSALPIQILNRPTSFCDLTQRIDSQDEKIVQFLEAFKVATWNTKTIEGIDKTRLVISLPLAFLTLLHESSDLVLSTQEREILRVAKSFEKKTKFYLSVPGYCFLALAAFMSSVAGGAGYYYGVKTPDIDPRNMAVLMGLATLVGALSSNLMGFYFTGTLPNDASEAENAEQNMWDDFAILKTKPAAYQLIEWYSPKLKSGESVEAFLTRRQIAHYFVETLKLQDVICQYKLRATQNEKIDVAFRYLFEAQAIIRHERLNPSKDYPIAGELKIAGQVLGYFTGMAV
jgi:hypothetical protein